MPEFDKNAGYIWTIVILGLLVPALLALYASIRTLLAKRRLERLEQDETEL